MTTQNISRIFSMAHSAARKNVRRAASYRAAFSSALSWAWGVVKSEVAAGIVKTAPMAAAARKNVQSFLEVLAPLVAKTTTYASVSNADLLDAGSLVMNAAKELTGFAQQVAQTVYNTKRCSEKQAWVIAKGCAEAGL